MTFVSDTCVTLYLCHRHSVSLDTAICITVSITLSLCVSRDRGIWLQSIKAQ